MPSTQLSCQHRALQPHQSNERNPGQQLSKSGSEDLAASACSYPHDGCFGVPADGDAASKGMGLSDMHMTLCNCASHAVWTQYLQVQTHM